MRDLQKDLEAWITDYDIGERGEWFYMIGEYIERAIQAEAEVERLRSLVNLCDICINRSEIPVCMPDDIEFGCGLGNDNIIKCRSFREIEKDRG